MLDLEDIFGHGGPARSGRCRTSGCAASSCAWRSASPMRSRGRESLIVEAGTGHRQDLRLPGAGAALRGARADLHRHAHAAGPAVREGPAAGQRARSAGRRGSRCSKGAPTTCAATAWRAPPRREQLALVDAAASGRAARSMLARIQRWARTTQRGDLAEVRGLSDSHAVWPQVTSTRESCLGVRCPEISRCHVALARREALEADIVIVNHHLLLADLALKEDGFGDLLGSADAVILDEAHQIPDLATQFFGAHVSSRQLETLLQAMCAPSSTLAPARAGAPQRRPRASAAPALQALEQALRELRAASSGDGRPHCLVGRQHARCASWRRRSSQPLEELSAALAARAQTAARRSCASAPRSSARALRASPRSTSRRVPAPLEVSARGFTLSLHAVRYLGALSRAGAARAAAPGSSPPRRCRSGRSSDISPAGSASPRRRRCASTAPSTTSARACCICRRDCPSRASRGYVAAVIDTALPLIEAARGGAFVLFTSHRALAQAARAAARALGAASSPTGCWCRARRRASGCCRNFAPTATRCCSAPRASGKGVDVKGDALRLVVIEKLPFASPEDPLVRARIEHLTAQRRQRVSRLPAAGGGARAEAGRRPADPQRG